MTIDIHVVPVSPTDWVVRDSSAREFGHYNTKAEAQAVGNKLARKRGAELIVHDERGAVARSRPRRGWLARLFGG